MEHVFATEYGASGAGNLTGFNTLLAAPLNIVADMNGRELNTKWFKKSGGNFLPLKEVANQYSYDNRIQAQQRSFITRKKWQPLLTGDPLLTFLNKNGL